MTNKIELAVSVDKEKLYVLEGDFDYETQIENILESFDFGRVEKAMKALNWKYWTSDFKEYFPNIQELKKTAKECLEHAIKCNFSETGGFLATHEFGVLNLYFVLEETLFDTSDLKNVRIYEKHLNKEKILKKIKKKI